MSPEMQANTPQSSTAQSTSNQSTSNQSVSAQASATQIDLPILRNGVRGRAVVLLQQLLEAQSYRTGGIDGIFGSKTEQAVRTYQKNFGLPQDGVVGPQTWDKLGDRLINP